jgi:transketolase
MTTTMRDQFAQTTTEILDDDPRTALVLADISAAMFADAADRHPNRIHNVGIRESLMVSVAGGLALTGLRPIAHSYAPFLIERAFEQIKLDLGHQGVSAVLVSIGASYDAAQAGRTHHAPGDVALLDSLPDWRVHVPGHAAEVDALLRRAAGEDGSVYLRLSTQHNAASHVEALNGTLVPLRTGRAGLVVAVGPMLEAALAATDGLDVSVAYTNTVRPFDSAGLRTLAAQDTVVLVEPYLAGTSAQAVAEALTDRPHRTLALGVGRTEQRRYGSPEDHAVLHGLDPAGLRRSITAFLAL